MGVTPRAMSWAFGTPLERALGGMPGLILADSVFPYTYPASDPPPWWTGPPSGVAEGWQRNFGENYPDGAPNFPGSREFTMVMPFMLGLRDSTTAPWRYYATGSQTDWPLDTPGMATTLLSYYIEHYLAEDAFLIPCLPEREVMNFLEATGPLGGDAPSAAAGESAIRAFIRFLLDPLNQVSDRIAGWMLIDEPNRALRRVWASPAALGRLRIFVRVEELEARRDLEPGFKDLHIQEQVERLHPCLITFNREGFFDPPGTQHPKDNLPFPIEEYYNASAADIYLYDNYQILRPKADIDADFESTCGFLPTDDYELDDDPTLSIKQMRELRTRLNTILLPGTPGYRAVGNWVQCGGAPWRVRNPSPPTAAMAPSPPPFPPSIAEGGDPVAVAAFCASGPVGGITYALPDPERLRYLLWGSLLSMSEGMPCFGQGGIADTDLLAIYAPLLQELKYFANFRWNNRSRRAALLPTRAEMLRFTDAGGWSPVAAPGNPRTVLPLQVFYAEYLGPPAAPFPSTTNIWFGIINHSSTAFPVDASTHVFRFTDLLGGGYRWQEIKLLSDTDPLTALKYERVPITTQGFAAIRVPAYSVRLFNLTQG